MSRRRTLHPDEHALWLTVARTAKPMHADAVRHAATPFAIPPDSKTAPQPVPLFRLGEKVRTSVAHNVASTLRDSLSAAPMQMDAKAYGKMTRGKLLPEARIDLHGMTLAEAHPELIRFILSAQSTGLRLVLVITGKGRGGPDHGPIPQRIGALRHQVPQWLRLAPLALAVLQVAEAHLKHGGTGAYYVYLRRR